VALMVPEQAVACRSFLALWSAATKDGFEFVWRWAFRFWFRFFLIAHGLRSLSRIFLSLSGTGRCGAGFG
jgi:hypothetical protein